MADTKTKKAAAPKPADHNASVTERLTRASLISVDYIAVPTALLPYVTTFYHFRCDEKDINEIQPAGIGHLVLFPRGKGKMKFPGGVVDPSNRTNLMTPSHAAAPFQVAGPFHALGAVLTPLGWAALTGLQAHKHSNRLLRAADHLGPEIGELGDELCRAYCAGEMDGKACAAQIASYIESNLKPVNPDHAELVLLTTQWLAESMDPSLSDLFGRTGYSKRQVQRLVERYFGLAPVALKRKYRALRAATFLSLPTLTPEFEATVHDAFYDQPHMIHEIRHFVGRTPARLGDGESAYHHEMLSQANLREISGSGNAAG